MTRLTSIISGLDELLSPRDYRDVGPNGLQVPGGQDVAKVVTGVSALLTGEPREHVMSLAREAGIHLIAAGHYATETFGVRALGDWLAERFGIEHV